MKTLSPCRDFCHIEDKYDPSFIFYDKDVSALGRSLYHRMFRLAGYNDYCFANQETLAEYVNTSVRTIQRLIHMLERLGYIQVKKVRLSPKEPIFVNHYYLLFSERVQSFIKEAKITLTNSQNTCTKTDEAVSSVKVTKKYFTSDKHIVHGRQNVVKSKNKEKKEINTQQKAFVSPASCSMPSIGQKGVCFSSRDVRGEFEKLFAAWPVKQDKLAALKMYEKLVKKQILPELSVLLQTIERFKREDRAWLNGYVPNLRQWLFGQRWNDQPRPQTKYDSPQCVHDDNVMQKQTAVQTSAEKAIQRIQLASQLKNESIRDAVEKLALLWPKTGRTQLFASVGLAKMRGISPENLVSSAQEYFKNISSLPPVPIHEWLQNGV